MSEYSSSHIGFASFAAFVLGQAAHIATVVSQDHRVRFYFDDPDGKCLELANAFFSPEGAQVDNARELLEANRNLKYSITLAKQNPDGIWQRE